MNIEKLNKWANLLLDTGKRNNLVNFREAKMGTAEVVSPSFDLLFSKSLHSASFEVYDPKLDDEEDEPLKANLGVANSSEQVDYAIMREEYIKTYAPRLKKNGQILIFSQFVNPLRALKNIGKKAKTAIEETGVNIAYMAFGFINWTEVGHLEHVMRAPILLVPISIENESAIEPYRIKITDSEIILNPTFHFKLKSEYGIDLPPYEEEDIHEYLEKISLIVSKLGWGVSKECRIGLFSFLKINMHKDIKDNAEKILTNKSVNAILGGKATDMPTEEFIGGDSMTDSSQMAEEGIEPDTGEAELYNVVDADSSQIEAIELAKEGKSFVLQGPPGTGKSQTITNIIAECLARGKKVLFVSEKLAALSVVYDKLKKAGLEEFCLELHSHKTGKREVIKELCRTIKLQRSTLSSRARVEVEAKTHAMHELDDYAEELHKVRQTINKSLYEIFGEASVCRRAPNVEFLLSNISEKGEEYLNLAETTISLYVKNIEDIGYDYHQNSWYGYRNTNCSYELTLELKKELSGLVDFCRGIKELNDKLKKEYFISALNVSQAYSLRSFFNLVCTSEFITPSLLNDSTLAKVTGAIKEMSALAKNALALKHRLDEAFDDDVYKLDGQSIYKKLTRQYGSFFARFFSGEYRQIAKEIKYCSKTGRRQSYKTLVSSMAELKDYQNVVKEFTLLEKKTGSILGSGYEGLTTDFAKLAEELTELEKIRFAKVDFGKLMSMPKESFLQRKGEFASISGCFNNLFERYSSTEEKMLRRFDPSEYDLRLAKIEELENKYQGCLDSVDKLDNWCEFIKVLDKLSELQIRSFIDHCIKKNVKREEILSAFKKVFFAQWIDLIIHETPILISLSRIPHDEMVSLFKKKDELTFEINKAKIKAKLSGERPSLDMVAQGSAISTLLREGEKKRKQKSIRVLLEEIGTLAQALKPCFLMSPLSVSTFLSPNMKFDVVVFDEASQIFPQDAIGAIYRGKQLIVVGDSKQMPPSNFFNSIAGQEDDEEEMDDITDYESILDLCSTSFLQKRLKWHYRSRFEQLIAFSNKNFYENELVTFPSPRKDSVGAGVDFFHVDGIFDRSTKTNRIEAEKIVDLVFENIENYPSRSLGVVAFSISQQNLIDRLIAKRRQLDPSKEAFFRSDKAEPFFVKNLETVQGDERDIIIFSIAYARDHDGRLLFNFGPLNREGGERRLNVAVTRAKCNLQVVSSMRYTDIDLSRTQSVGAKLLRDYLEYAENGEISRQKEEDNPFGVRDYHFEREVCEFLVEKGYCVDTKVGRSGFKIDLALKYPDSEDYALAIECDGEDYHSAKSTRDRDRLRQAILERMGWKFYRIWSADWFRNKRVEKERLLVAVKGALENTVANKKVEERKEKSNSFSETAIEARFEFPEYQKANEYRIAEACKYDVARTTLEILKVEAPLSEDWLLHRLLFMFGKEKITQGVRNDFEWYMKDSKSLGIVRREGFLYLEGACIPMLRVPKRDGKLVRDVRQIATEELANGLREVLKHNVTATKSGVFKFVALQLGFTRIGEAISEKLEKALCLLSGEIEIDGEALSLK